MATQQRFAINPGWRILFRGMGLPVAETLRDAGLSTDFFNDLPAMLDPDRYFALWQAMDRATGARELPLLIAQALDVEVFSPPLFAAVCSPDLRHAARRVARYKALTGPVTLEVDDAVGGLTLRWRWPLKMDPPLPYLLCELMFWSFIARKCTRLAVNPKQVTLPSLPAVPAPYEAFFRTAIRQNGAVSISFTQADARLPFLTVNDAIWSAFEPELRRQKEALADRASTTEQVRAVLLRAIPAACASADHAAEALALSPRTLQRRLGDEGTSFKALLNGTRLELAQHYLSDGHLSLAEISFLLGYQDPSSFNRAFRQWTGNTPERFRTGARRDAKQPSTRVAEGIA